MTKGSSQHSNSTAASVVFVQPTDPPAWMKLLGSVKMDVIVGRLYRQRPTDRLLLNRLGALSAAAFALGDPSVLGSD